MLMSRVMLSLCLFQVMVESHLGLRLACMPYSLGLTPMYLQIVFLFRLAIESFLWRRKEDRSHYAADHLSGLSARPDQIILVWACLGSLRGFTSSDRVHIARVEENI